MGLELTESRSYQHAVDTVFAAATGAVAGLEGTIVSQNPNDGELVAKFDKKILGNVLGDRTQIEVRVAADKAGGSAVAYKIIPLDPLGRPLMFGARKGVTRTVTDWFFAHLEHRLPK